MTDQDDNPRELAAQIPRNGRLPDQPAPDEDSDSDDPRTLAQRVSRSTTRPDLPARRP